MHPNKSELANQEVRLKDPEPKVVRVVDWADRYFDLENWREVMARAPMVLLYTSRSVVHQLPDDNEVLMVRRNGMLRLVHVSELELPSDQQLIEQDLDEPIP